jgi:superfamily II DNA or RNA helicase
MSWPLPPDTPRIVAEALEPLGEAPLPLRAGPVLPAPVVAAAIARAALPPEREIPVPEWLRPPQATLVRRTLASLDAFGGVMIAEPTGTGKTWIALAAASVAARGPHHCLVPAALTSQWRATAARLGIEVVITSHERASRGGLPAGPGMAIVDESHHFRNPATRRYAHASRWLAGRRAVLLTATPIVNRIADLTAQLALVLRDDALAQAGIISLRALADDAARSRLPALPAALARVVLASAMPDRSLPPRRVVVERATDGLAQAVEAIDRLALSRSPPIAALIRGVLLRAAASSPAALAGALRRYRLLLLHASDARAAGVAPGRAALRQWIGESAEQTALWPLLAEDGDPELVPEDLEAVTAAEAAQAAALRTADAKAMRLAAIVGDGRKTLVFTAARDTALWLRDRVGVPAAWCTGDRAGIGRTAVPRSAVLAGFQPGGVDLAPRVLIATDVAAEGLDLQRAERVVHYDLPWTPTRLEQREGRAARIGGIAQGIEVVRFEPPEAIERRLRQAHILRRKAALPARAGLAGASLQRWRALVERLSARAPSTAGGIGCTAMVTWAGRDGFLASLTLVEAASAGVAASANFTAWFGDDGAPTQDPGQMAAALLAAESAAAAHGASVPDREALGRAMDAIRRQARALLRDAQAAPWTRTAPVPAVRQLARRLGAAGRDAARRRSSREVDAVDRGLRFLARGHTAGELRLIAELASLPGAELRRRLERLPGPPRSGALTVRMDGLILFRSESPPLR